MTSPHLAALGLPAAFDDGVVVAEGTLAGAPVLAASQEGAFMGGSVGEVHGAKLVGLLRRARAARPRGVVLLLDSGGVRLQEANAGLVAVSEVMRAVLETRAAGVPVVALIGGAWGCFGGMGIVARCCDAIAMSEEGRLGLSGPDVIEATQGVEELDASDRGLVWRTYGGKHRWILGEADLLLDDDVAAFRAAAIELLGRARPLAPEPLAREQARPRGAARARRRLLRRGRRVAARGRRGPAAAAAPGGGGVQGGGRPRAEGARRGLARGRRSARGAGRWPAIRGPGARGALPARPRRAGGGRDPARRRPRARRARSPSWEASAAPRWASRQALALAGEVLRVVRELPGRPLLALVDSRGQRMSRRDELLGLCGFLGHLASCVELARARGHRVLALVRGDAVSGGVLPLGFMADEIDALEGANPWVMSIPAMARVTKLPVERLEELSRSSPVLAPGLDGFLRLGAIEAVWRPPLDVALAAALARPASPDLRAARGLSRGGRLLAAPIADRVAGGARAR